MRLTAYSRETTKPWGAWDDVTMWRLDGPRLHLLRHGRPEVVELPYEVVGLADDTPSRPLPPNTWTTKREHAREERPQSFRTDLPRREETDRPQRRDDKPWRR